jgi:hypothetical protein
VIDFGRVHPAVLCRLRLVVLLLPFPQSLVALELRHLQTT